MLRSPTMRWILGLAAFVAVITLLRYRPWEPRGERQSGGIAHRETLAVGFLPVTCHLTCPVTDFATRTSASTRFESQRFTDFPTIVESMKGGRLQASFMIAPLAMKTYTAPLLPLEEDSSYLLHFSDWQNFHTRYVTAEPFMRALWESGPQK